MYAEVTLSEYLDRAASGEPIPGGGSVAALVGALGASMASMACNFTVGKKKYGDVEADIAAVLKESEKTRRTLLELAGRDSEVYLEVSSAYKLPKETEDEKAKRDRAIQAAVRKAMDVPIRVMRECAALLKRLKEIAEKGNPNLISDVGVSAVLLEAALQAALLNVEINLRALEDCSVVEEVGEEVKRLTESAIEAADETLTAVRSRMC